MKTRNAPRSYVVKTDSNTAVIRNREHLIGIFLLNRIMNLQIIIPMWPALFVII